MAEAEPKQYHAETIEADKCEILDRGATLRKEIVAYLARLRKYQVRFLTRHEALHDFEEELDALYERFISYDNEVSTFMLFLATGLIIEKEGLMIVAVDSSHLSSSRENVRTLLRECNNALRNRQNQIDNRTATRIAFIALLATVILGLLSVIVAVIQLYLSPDATLPSLH